MPGALRRRDARARAEAIVGPNMTPMVDVILVILIFFMATTMIVGEEWFLGAGVSRPAQAGGEAPAPTAAPFELPAPRFTLRLSRTTDGRTMIRGIGTGAAVEGPRRMDQWADAALAGLDAQALVMLIDPAPDVPYEDVVALHDALTRAGVKSVALAGASASGAGASTGAPGTGEAP